ncbi:MAG: DUF2934 domain-containing protein [Chitinispirillaceae bacterium]|nr:DUF2934 domain-containing protein [Chitinispirillaceae bacterium]
MEKLQEKIAKRAYELFQARGGQHGYHIADWLNAEKEILKVTAAPAGQAKPAASKAPAVASKATPAPASMLRKKR